MSALLQIDRTRQSAAAPCAGRLLGAVEVAAITGLSVETLAQWRSQRRGIPFVKISRNVVRYRQADLDKFLEERIVRVEAGQLHGRGNR
ncbi:MAG: helix-turn-helix transcriptional regulator [Candidatus Acidiferrales bacterium]